MKRIIIHGLNSFIGINCNKLLKKSYEIIKFKKKLKLKNKKNYYFFHLSAMTSVLRSFDNPNLTIDTNTRLLLESLEFCRKYKVKLVFFSTVYQHENKKFSSPYSFSKYICEKICEYYSSEFNMDICIVRLSNVYGKHQKRNLISDMIRKLKFKKKIQIKNFKLFRDFLYIKDLIAALEKIISNFPKKINVFNISQNKNLKIIEAILIIKEVLNSKSFLDKTDSRNLQTTFRNVKISNYKFKKKFNWKPKFTFKDGIKDLIS